jgi:hypothetical protein
LVRAKVLILWIAPCKFLRLKEIGLLLRPGAGFPVQMRKGGFRRLLL